MDDTTQQVIETIARVLGMKAERIAADDDFPGDSLDKAEVEVVVEADWGVNLKEWRTPADLAALVERERGHG